MHKNGQYAQEPKTTARGARTWWRLLLLLSCLTAVALLVHKGSGTAEVRMHGFVLYTYNSSAMVLFLPFVLSMAVMDKWILPQESIRAVKAGAAILALVCLGVAGRHFYLFPPFPWASPGGMPLSATRPPSAFGYALSFAPGLWAAYRAFYPTVLRKKGYFFRALFGFVLLCINTCILDWFIETQLYANDLGNIFYPSSASLPLARQAAACAVTTLFIWTLWKKRALLIFALAGLLTACEMFWMAYGALSDSFRHLEISH